MKRAILINVLLAVVLVLLVLLPVRRTWVGRALPIKLHSQVDLRDWPEEQARREKRWEEEGGHPQKRMMRAVADSAPGSVLCFDCGGDMQPAHFGEMSCQLAYAHGCRGMLLAGNCRDTHYGLKMPDFPMFSFGTRPNAFGGWIIIEVNTQLPPIGSGRPFVDIACRLTPKDVESRFPRVGPGYVELTIRRRQVGERRDDLMLAEWFSRSSPEPGCDEIWNSLTRGFESPHIRLELGYRRGTPGKAP